MWMPVITLTTLKSLIMPESDSAKNVTLCRDYAPYKSHTLHTNLHTLHKGKYRTPLRGFYDLGSANPAVLEFCTVGGAGGAGGAGDGGGDGDDDGDGDGDGAGAYADANAEAVRLSVRPSVRLSSRLPVGLSACLSARRIVARRESQTTV